MTPSPLYAELLSDPAVDQHLSAEAEIAAMIAVEAALARVQGRLGVLPVDKASTLSAALSEIEIEPAALATAVARDGVAVPGLVAELRRRLPPDLADLAHWGATSQDIVDTGLMMRLQRATGEIEAGLAVAADALAILADAHRATPMIGRTRRQAATPIVFGRRVAGWLAPLTRARQRLRDMRSHVFAVQFGGAAGDLSVLGPSGLAVADALADELGLAKATPWHVERDRLVAIGDWLSAVATCFGRIGADLLIMTRSEIGEIRLGKTGGSSTMPHKQNPVAPEAMSALAGRAAALAGDLHISARPVEERDGDLWITEWTILPALASAAGGAVRLGAETLPELEIERARMARNLAATRGLLLAEAASFALAPSLGRADAKRVTREAALATGADPALSFLDALSDRIEDPALLSPLGSGAPVSASSAIIDRILADHHALSAQS